ncbi:MAG: DUF3365 domain-containing protein [Bacteroidetes bacterium]|jgi:hypothetical protein|nr:DUF3365 domain-containing protein [Bacteroidota bacterium]
MNSNSKFRFFQMVIFLLMIVATTSCNQRAVTEKNENSQQSADESSLMIQPTQDTTLEVYREQGKTIVKATFKALSAQLKSALQQEGVPFALSFCNVAALPITDSLAKLYQVDIKRVSLRNRNPDNAPTAMEKSLLQSIDKLAVASYDGLTMVVRDQDENPVFVQPIVVADNCLQCHGNVKTQIGETNYELIKSLYPNDLATGYQVGDLRGIWRVRFSENPAE